jgi:hypothetical protein
MAMDSWLNSSNDVPRAIIPHNPLLGVVPARVCEACGGSVSWSGTQLLCESCGGGNYRMRELGRLPEKREISEPEWTGGFRGQVAKLLWGRGLKAKALRFLSCNKIARPGVCVRYPFEHKYFVPHGCEVVFCQECAQESRRVLFMAYWHVVCNVILEFACKRQEHEQLCALLDKISGNERQNVEEQLRKLWAQVARSLKKQGWVLARVNFTLRSDGSEITPHRVKGMNSCIRKVMRHTVGSRKGFGLLFVDEVGFEKRGHLPDCMRLAHGLNLHAHGLYFGPRLDWTRTRDLWLAATRAEFGVESRGFYIKAVPGLAKNPGRAIRHGLNHMLKYVSKPPAVTPERLASLIAAFDGAKRVHALGLFYGKKPKRVKKECPCPKCRQQGIVSSIEFEGQALGDGLCIPRFEKIEILLSRGYVPLRDAGREAIFSVGAPLGASP